MWNSYFYNIQKKYSMRLSYKEPLIIRMDGKGVTKNKGINLIDDFDGGFLHAMRKTVEYFTEKYNCYAIYGSDEVSFIITDPVLLMEDLDSDKDNHSNEVISLFSQYFFHYFNSFNKNKLFYWHAKCFSIPQEKISSYIRHRSRIIENVMATYFLKRNNIKMGNIKLEDRIDECKKMSNYKLLEKIQKGILYYDGKQINLNDFLNGNIVFVEEDMSDLFSELF